MKKALIIQIPEHCNEKWSTMELTDQGRACKRCNKEVIDFSNYSIAQLAAYFSKNTTDVCGNFSADQLGVNLLSAGPMPFNRFSLQSLAFIALMMTVNPVYGQSLTDKQFASVADSIAGSPNTGIPDRLTGTITDSLNGKPIQNITIHLKCEDHLISSHIAFYDGKFSIQLPENTPYDHLVVTAENHYDTVVPLTPKDRFSSLVIPLRLRNSEATVPEPVMMRGSTLVVTRVTPRKKHRLRRN
jgi:hypothetical protein